MRPFGFAVLLLLGAPAAPAQTAPPVPGPVRPPAANPWRVLSMETEPPDKERVCLLTIADPDSQPSNPASWALRQSRSRMVVIENSMGVGDATIPSFTLAINGQEFGPFAIRERRHTPEHVPSVVKYVSALAPVTGPATIGRIVAALRPGAAIRVERRGKVLDAVLDPEAATAFEACRRALVR